MKKLLLLFTACTLTFTSCSDNNDSSAVDPIIGTWTWYQGFEDGVEENLDSCDLMDTLIFNEDGTYTETTHFTKPDGTCEVDSDKAPGTWTSDGNGSYTFVNDSRTRILNITFEGNTYSYEEIKGDYTYKDVYKRK